jgi:hypothetical protein
MESQRFDQIAKHVSRRSVTKGLLAGGLGGLITLLGRQPSKAQGCEAACADGDCADLKGQAKGDCMRACTGQCGCPPDTTFCPDDGLCYNLKTNNCHCADPLASGGIPNPCGGRCGFEPGTRCCVEGVCIAQSPRPTCPPPGEATYCTEGVRPHST